MSVGRLRTVGEVRGIKTVLKCVHQKVLTLYRDK